jgi:hypothetical protein
MFWRLWRQYAFNYRDIIRYMVAVCVKRADQILRLPQKMR